jgi:hypothetical protein
MTPGCPILPTLTGRGRGGQGGQHRSPRSAYIDDVPDPHYVGLLVETDLPRPGTDHIGIA